MWSTIWKLKVPNKIRNFWWRACRNSLATKENLVRRKCGRSKVCPVCLQFDESIEHLLFKCQWTRAVWFGCNVNLDVNCESNSSILKWTSHILDSRPVEEAKSLLERVVFIAWYIWKSRNEFIFESVPVNPMATMLRAMEAYGEFLSISNSQQVPMDNPQTVDSYSQWRAPGRGSYKLNCDVAVVDNGKEGKTAAVIRDWKGSLVNGSTGSCEIASTLQGELNAIRMACKMAASMEINQATIESDCQQAIKLSVSEQDPPWDVMALVFDIRYFRNLLGLSFSWVRREANGLAHEVATSFKKGKLPLNWVSCPSPSILSLLARDFLSVV